MTSHGTSETSRAIEKAYSVTRYAPDPRDAKIKELEKENESMRTKLSDVYDLLVCAPYWGRC